MAYRAQPFQANESRDDFQDYTPAHQTAGQSIPLRPYGESVDDLLTPTGGNYRDYDNSHTNIAGGAGVPAGAAAAYNFGGPRAMADNGYGGGETGYAMNRGAPTGSGYGGAEPKYAFSGPGGGYSASANAWEVPAKSNKKKWIFIFGGIGVAILVIIGVVVGVVVSKSHSNKNLSSSSGGSKNSPVQSDPNDPSKFTKDSNLHQSLYGMAYTPYGSQLPDCGNSLAAVITDVQLMSQLTKRIRLYGADCNQSALVLEAIKQTKVDMQVFLGNYPIATDNGAAYQRQRDIIRSALQTYGADHVGGVTVGNEFMLNYLNANAATDANSATGDTGAQILIANIQDTKSMISDLGLKIPVGNSDAGSYFNNKVLSAVDYGMANVHPWFANVSAEYSASWTADFFSQQDVALANGLPNKPKMYIAETGWPTKSSDAGNANNGPSIASEGNLQIFLDNFVCQANTNGTGYFFFEFADEDWKDKQFGGVEGWWGLFTQDRKLRNVKIPNCASP